MGRKPLHTADENVQVVLSVLRGEILMALAGNDLSLGLPTMKRRFSSGGVAFAAFGFACDVLAGVLFSVRVFVGLLVAAIPVILRIDEQDKRRGREIDRKLRRITSNE